MHNAHSRLKQAFLGVTILAGIALAPSPAQAGPGSCSCNSGCHANVGQCIQSAACAKGYAPACGARTADGGSPVCPKVGSVSCDGTCTCTPIPFFCDTVGGADYCPEPGTDGGTTGDGGTTSDSSTTGDGSTGSDTKPPPSDATPPPDAKLPPDDAPATLPDGAACPPPVCPAGTRVVVIPKQCDPYCAQPCGAGEFKCPPSEACVDGWCVPPCLAISCKECQRCDLGGGTCYDDPTACSDAGAGDGGGLLDDGGFGGDSGDGSNGDLPNTSNGGCGCALPGGANSDTIALASAFGLLIALGLARRPRKR